jgi:pyruvate,orthophosphate dikinase
MFLGDRRQLVEDLVLAREGADQQTALAALLPLQREDFVGILRAMDGLPVTVRLLDPPLHEFVPHDEAGQRVMAAEMKVSLGKVRLRVEELHEFNPMMGHRGCRLGISYPEITEMQARAVLEAALDARAKGAGLKVEIMVPLVGTVREFNAQAAVIRRTARQVFAERGEEIGFLLGTMIETPRAALLADSIGRQAEFFSFGTNDLTQMTMGFSRDDAGKFLPDYLKAGIYEHDPFRVVDQKGVGLLIRMAVEKGRAVRPGIEVGVCGEHGGEPASVGFFHRAGLDYVSCSPFRVPIARLAAAQAAVDD